MLARQLIELLEGFYLLKRKRNYTRDRSPFSLDLLFLHLPRELNTTNYVELPYTTAVGSSPHAPHPLVYILTSLLEIPIALPLIVSPRGSLSPLLFFVFSNG